MMFVLFIVYFIIVCAFMSIHKESLAIYAIPMFWGTLCMSLVLHLFIRRVRVILSRLEHYLRMRTWCSGTMDSLGYVLFLLDLAGRRQMVTELSVRLLYGFCVIPPARIRSRSHIIFGPWIWTGYSPHVK